MADKARGLFQLSERIWIKEIDLDAYGVRGAVLLGDEAAVVFDSLSLPADMADVAPLLGGRRVIVVYSHADWDHVWGTAGLPGAVVVAHEAARARFASDVPQKLAQKRLAEPGRWDDVVLVPPGQVFADTLRLDLGGLTLELSHLPGHTPDSLVGFVPEEGLLLAGDTVETPFPCLGEDSPLPLWIAALRGWAGDGRVRSVVPAHGPMGGREIVANSAEYLQALAEGRPIDVPAGLPDFYREAHQDNLRFVSGPVT